MQRFTSKRRNLNVDATLAAGTLGESPLSSPLRKDLHRPSALTPLSPNGLLSPRNLPASLDRVPSEYASKTTSIHACGHGFLVYGTIVSCLSMDRGGFLAGDGLITSEVRLEGLVQSLKATVDLIDAQLTDPGSQRDVHVVACHAKDCLFEVLPKMVYEATAAFEEAKASENASTTSTGFSDAFSDLKFKSESELRLNANVYDKLHGTRVKYGQTVQLRHIKTGKYIAMQPTRDKDTLEVVLSDGAAACHLTLQPRFKLRKTGEPVQLMDQIVLAATYKAQRFAMHVSTRSAVDGASTLVHASLSHASQWRLAPYDHSEKDVSSATTYQPDTGRGLRSGLCIRLLHLETSAWLGCGGGAVHLQAESGSASDAADTNSHLLSPETLWEVEKSCFLDGGLLHWTDSVCLRHVLTGQYLHVENTEAGLRVATNAQPQSSYLLRPTTLVNPRNPIGHKSAVLLQHAQTLTYLHTRSSAHLHVSSPLVTLPTPQDEDAFKIVSVSSTELHDTSRLLAYRTLCESFIASFASASGGGPRLDDVERVLSQLNTFTFLDTQTPDHVLWLRQTLLHRHQFVPLLTRMLEAPFAAYGGPFSIDYVCGFQPQNEPSDGIEELHHTNDLMSPGGGRFSNGVAPPPPPPMDKSLPIMFQWPDTAMWQLHHVLCAINILLFRMFYSSKTSDTSACRHAMPVLLALLGHGFKASVPLSYLIQEKFHLSESFASFSAIVRNFFDLIRRHGRAMRYLQFLVVLCSANGHAVPKVQEKICELLFNPSHGYSDAVLVHTRPTPTGLELCVDAVADTWVPLRAFFDDYYSHKSHATLAPYFYGLLQLYCALCMDRNYTCIRCLTGSFPRASLLACVQDPALSRSIRAVLLNLLVALHLDCEPQTPLPSPNYTRIWKEVLLHQDKLPVARDDMYAADDWTFFGQLQTLAMTYFRKQNGLVIITEAAQNDLTLAFVRLCKKMVAFGLFRSIAELGALVLELVKLLDSRTDYWYKPSTRSHRELLDATEVVVSPTFFHRSFESTRFDLQAQNAIIQQTEGGHAMRRASLEPARLATKKTLEPASMRRRRRSANSPKLKSPVEPPMRTKFQMTGLTQVLMEIKDDICATLLLVDALRLDAQISTVLVTLATEPPFHGPRWRRHASKPLSTLARSMFETPSLSCRYSLSELAHRPVDTILLQALMYEHPPLVSKALELLMQQFNQHEQVTKALSNVLLLVNDATVGIYGQLQADVQRLRHFAETTEVWMNLSSTEDFRVATSVTGLLTSFTAHLQSSGIVTEIRERRQSLKIGLPRTAAHPASAHQVEVRRLLRNLNAMQTIFDMLRDGNHFFKSHFPSVLGDASRATSPMAHATSSFSRMQQQTALRPVFVEALRFFFAFGADNSMNVALLAEHTLALLDLVEEIEEAQDVLALVYGSSESLCKAIPVKVLQHFLDLWRVDLDVHAQTKGRYLHALEAFVSVGDTPVPENQLVVLLELVKPDAGYLQLLGAAPTSFLALLTETKEALTTQRDAKVTYHLDVLHLLASCAMGTDARLKDFCASTLSLDALLSLLHAAAFACVGSLHEYPWLGNVAMALVRFLKEVYLTSEAPSWAQQPQATHDQIVTTLESLLVECTWRLLSSMILHIFYQLDAFAHLCHLQQKDALTPPQAHVVYDGGRIWVDVAAASYKKLATDDPPYESHLLTLLLPALHACLVELSAPASVLISLYETLFSLLSTAVTATTFAQLSPSNQDALLASARVLDKLASAQNDPSALENLAYEASARPKRPHLGQNRVLRSIVLGEASARETLRALYEQLQHPDTAMASPPRASLTARPKDVWHVSRSSPTKGLAPLRQATTPLSPPSPMKSPSQWHSSLARCRQLLMRAPLDGGWDGAKNAGLVPVVASEDGTVLDAFLSLVKADPETDVARSAELHAMMQRILHLEAALRDEAESISDVPKSSLTFDDVILKLIEHFKLLKHAKYAKMSADLLDIFCQMIKSLEPSRRHAMQQKLDKLGLTVLVVNIISSTTDRVVFDSSIALGIALLDGMNAKVQEHFYATWTESKTTKFFERLKHRMDSATDEVKTVAQVPALDDLPRPHSMVLRLSHEARSGRSLELADDPPYASIVAIFRFLQLLCEGHYLHAQQYLLSQGSAVSSINLVEATTSFLLEIYPSLNSANVLLFKQLFDTITEFCQGPCPEAQECVANYKFISVVNELLVVTSLPESDARLHMRQLKGAIVVCLLSLIEGRTDDIIHDRLVTELNFDTIKDNVVDVHRYFQETYHGVYDGNTACSTDAFLALGFNVHILIQHLMEYQPSLGNTLFPKQSTSHLTQVERSFSLLTYEAFTRWLKATANAEFASGLQQKDAAYAVAYAFFDAKCARVELVWHLRGDPHLVQIYFPVHPICCCVTERSKDRLKTHMPLDPSSKLSAFFAHTSNLLHEMEYQSQLQQQFLLAWLLRQTHRLQVLSFVLALLLALLINLLVVTTLRADASTSQPYSAWQQGATRDGPGIDALLMVLGSIQVALCTTVFVLYAVRTVPLLITEGWHAEKRKLKNTIGGASTPYARSDVDATESLQDVEDLLRLLGDRDEDVLRTKQDRVRNIVVSVRFLLRDPRLVYYGLLVMIPALGTYVHVQFFAFHVLDIINRSQELKNVLKAVVLPGKSLLLIFALYLLLVYIFATIGFFNFRPDYTPEAMANPNAPQRCSTLFLCFLSSFDLAFKSNGGLGGFLLPRALGTDPLATGRFLFDNAYNIILMVILLNITFGIIIDTFATIRTSHKERAEELRDRCFICSIDGYTFDRLTKRGFEYHTRLEHNMWHYLYLFVHINKKDYTEYNGIELYLAMKMAKNDVSFFPNHRAMALEKADPTLQLVPDDDQNESNKKPTATPVTLSEVKRGSTDRKLDVLAKKEDPGTARLEKHLDALFEQHESLRERQKSIEDVQRQVLATQQAILALLNNQTASPVKLQRKSEHFFPE